MRAHARSIINAKNIVKQSVSGRRLQQVIIFLPTLCPHESVSHHITSHSFCSSFPLSLSFSLSLFVSLYICLFASVFSHRSVVKIWDCRIQRRPCASPSSSSSFSSSSPLSSLRPCLLFRALARQGRQTPRHRLALAQVLDMIGFPRVMRVSRV